MSNDFEIKQARPDEQTASGLAQVLVDCVEGGASVGFMAPITTDRARSYFSESLRGAERGERIVLVAEETNSEVLIGTVQLLLSSPENQPHRGEIAKMIVTRAARRRGVGEALMREAERLAAEAGKTLLNLDTASPDAERLYERLGWQKVGVIPRYALGPFGEFVPTTIYFKDLT